MAMAESQDSNSIETFDLAGDLDLEAQLTLTESKVDLKPDTAHAPATLAADDPENPRDWSTAHRAMINSILCVWVLTLTYSSTAYSVSSIPTLMQQYHMSQEVAILGVTLFVFGFAAGPLLFGPASELYGRQAVYRTCGLLYSAFGFGAAFAPNTSGLLIFRFLVGFFGSAYSTLYALCAFGGPALGPLASAFIQHDAVPQWNLRVMAVFSAILSILVALVPETHGPTKVMSVFRVALARPIIYLFTEPVVMLVSLYLSTLYGALYGFIQAFSVVYLEIRGFKSTSFGLTYIALGLGFGAACIVLTTIGLLYEKSASIDAAKGRRHSPKPTRISLLFAWTAPFASVHWIVPCIAQFFLRSACFDIHRICTTLLFCFSRLIYAHQIPYLIDCYQMTAASALAAGMASRALVGSIFPLFALQMYHSLTVQGATSLIAGITCLLAPIPFIFRVYGARMRERSKYAVVST
ncbi:major facilitator superfamily domain-containing protein [Mycena leptocephala]|nr:major facilitator superfamily domain-containing protein [Mycena leptocephala]